MLLLILLSLLALTASVKIGVSKHSSSSTTSTTTPASASSTAASTNSANISNTTATYSEATTLPPENVESTEVGITAASSKKPPVEWAPPTLPSKPKTKTAKKSSITTESPVSLENSQETNDTISRIAESQAHTDQQSLLKNFDFFCHCNLQLNACDINCCCDPECTSEALKVFKCHEQSLPELPHSLQQDFQYEHGLPSCKINDGWLCVFRTNTKQELIKVSIL